MARVTIEDYRANRYELVYLTAFRTKQISAGSPPLVERDNDKDPVIALREFAGEKIKLDELRDAAVKKEQVFKILSAKDQQEEQVKKSQDSQEIQNEMNSYQDVLLPEDETLQGFYQEEDDLSADEEEK